MGEEKGSNKNPNNRTKEASHHNRNGYPNPPESGIPDPETLREQWSYAKRQYSRWYSSAWGSAILAGLSLYALGWIIKGSNPLPSLSSPSSSSNNNNNIINNNNNNNSKERGSNDDEGYVTSPPPKDDIPKS